jgi:hypothetical protein
LTLSLAGLFTLGACQSTDSAEAKARDACDNEAVLSTEYTQAAQGQKQEAREAYVRQCMSSKGF